MSLGMLGADSLTIAALAGAGSTSNSITYYDTLGDSRLDLEDITTDGLRKGASCFINQLNYRPTFNNRLRRSYKGAKAGWMSCEYLPMHLANVLNSQSSLVFLFGIVNDVGQDVTAAQIMNGYNFGSQPHGVQADSTAIGGISGAIAKITAAGKRVVCLTDWPAQGTTSARLFQIIAYNNMLRDIAAKNRLVTLVDSWPIMVDPTSASLSTILRAANFQIETPVQHPNMAGSMALAAAFEPALLPFIPPYDLGRAASRLDGPQTGADATLLTNYLWNSTFQEADGGPSFQGAGSAAGSAGAITGTVPGGWRITSDAGISITLTTPSGSFGNDFQLAITAANAGSAYLRQGLNPAGRANQNPALGGLFLQQTAELDVAAGSSSFLGAQLEGIYQAPGIATTFGANTVDQGTPGQGPTTAYSQVLAAPIAQIPQGATTVQAGVRLLFNAAGSATVKLRRLDFRLRLSAA